MLSVAVFGLINTARVSSHAVGDLETVAVGSADDHLRMYPGAIVHKMAKTITRCSIKYEFGQRNGSAGEYLVHGN